MCNKGAKCRIVAQERDKATLEGDNDSFDPY